MTTDLFGLGVIDLFAPPQRGRPKASGKVATPTTAPQTAQILPLPRRPEQPRFALVSRVIYLRTQYCECCNSEVTFPDAEFVVEVATSGTLAKSNLRQWRKRDEYSHIAEAALNALPLELHNVRENITACVSCLHLGLLAGNTNLAQTFHGLANDLQQRPLPFDARHETN